MAKKTRRFSVSMTDELYTAVENAAEEAEQDMSRLIRNALVFYLSEKFDVSIEDAHPPRGGDMRKRKSIS